MKKFLCMVIICGLFFSVPAAAFAHGGYVVEGLLVTLINELIREAREKDRNESREKEREPQVTTSGRAASRRRIKAKKSTKQITELSKEQYNDFCEICFADAVDDFVEKYVNDNLSPNAACHMIDSSGEWDASLLAIAASQSHNAEIIDFLIDEGADVDISNGLGKGTPLLFAAERVNVEIMAALLEAGADINAKSLTGTTALMKIFQQQNIIPSYEFIDILLKAGANAKLRDNDGKRAIDYARQNPKLKGTRALKRLQEASQTAKTSTRKTKSNIKK